MKNILTLLAAVFISTFSFSQESENQFNWPREIISGEYTITLYQPQLEELKGNVLTGRMALSVQGEEMIFGALWFEARLSTDLTNRTAILERIDIPKLNFPDIENDSKLDSLKLLIIQDFEGVEIVMSLDRIIAGLENTNKISDLETQLYNDAPEIYFRTDPTVLVSIDGDPILEDVEDSFVDYVVNTPFFIVKNKSKYYLYGSGTWYVSDEIVSNNWEITTTIPRDVKKLAKKKIEVDESSDDIPEEEIVRPNIIVVTTPSELILTDGKMEYNTIDSTSLLYVSNTESDIIMDINSQKHYILINGRWFHSTSLKDGEWAFAEPEMLPKDFLKIPASSEIAAVRISVPGTAESEAAVQEQYIPQTAVVDRKTASVEVEYDGKPEFELIEGTTISQAINTDKTVLMIENKYYCVDDGIWFESSKSTGPWIVSDSRPEEVEDIPPSSSSYNVKYVYIYDSTPDVVYVGYMPGYYHSYVYGGVVVYGTGYYYNPWYGNYYYPHPVTYGYGVHYSPYSGWGFHAGVSYGWFVYSPHHHHYWGPAGYHHGYRHGYNSHYNHHHHSTHYQKPRGNYNRNVYQNRTNGRGVKQSGNNNRNLGNNDRNLGNNDRNNNLNQSKKSNNLYSDRQGNVHQRDKDGNWSQKSNTQKSGTRTNPSNNRNPRMESQYNNRDRGNSNYSKYKGSTSRGSNPNVGGSRRSGSGGGSSRSRGRG